MFTEPSNKPATQFKEGKTPNLSVICKEGKTPDLSVICLHARSVKLYLAQQ